ncbi:hypothetical protein MNBD_PLANCTO02-1697 [hydrothermal vent metagenome]|uniref:Mobile element protein n=1 Tax=hydrothermal vent metagenome TaxID=652676 RepID=A0A3B1D818_9ZZZZ
MEHKYHSVKQVVSWGLLHRCLDGIQSIGIDEVQSKRGHKYQTVVYQIDEGCKRWLRADFDGVPLVVVEAIGES